MKLKPCPFCGRETDHDLGYQFTNYKKGGSVGRVVCIRCQASGPQRYFENMDDFHSSCALLGERWNIRQEKKRVKK